ncbi:MAG: 16S rRNA (cytosine(1402)-N(4))-methyltransferase RsmH [Geodermatophilaceae bacterium]|nr:16S rRNA (cytosine(1402)-N(4))-methyltransferase RsmH [Geodermatophilaceae bacterium]
MNTSPGHVPVLLSRVSELLAPVAARPAAVIVDATVGLGGHAQALLAAHRDLRIIGLDRDPAALRISADRLTAYRDRVRLVHTRFDELGDVLEESGETAVDGVLFDLGVSSMQLDEAERGFSYSGDTGLDMRMDSTAPLTAEKIVNTYTRGELTRVLRNFGEERFASRVAAAIVRERARAPITSSAALADLIRSAIPAATRRTGGHPAKRTFQGLRIEVNGELAALEAALPIAIETLRPGGRLVAISYHSLEDRIVKRALVRDTQDSTPIDLPVLLPQAQPRLRMLTRGAELPTAEETEVNPRAASAKLRAAERVDNASPLRVADAPSALRNRGAA